jgi:hypothetical protein
MNALPSPPSSQSTPISPPPRALKRLGLIDAEREVVVLAAASGSVLVVDRRMDDGSDPRLVARLAADEPRGNAVIIGDIYMADARRPTCRRVEAEDFAAAEEAPPEFDRPTGDPVLVDRHGIRFRLALLPNAEHRVPELRWLREPPDGVLGPPECVSARRVVGALEDYEPVRSLTAAAVDRHRYDPGVSVATLGLELRRLGASPIVLNRRLREAVIDASSRRGLSLSAIALACGRAKLDRRGRHSGETSWLARRVGLLADDPGRRPNPWVHTDVLALIARNGLGVAPHEVELG